MPDQGSWISLERAVAAVHAAIGGSPGPVYQTLISACAEGLVRARWTLHYLGAAPAIHKRDWIGADIDWANHRIVKADGSGMYGVDFSEDDLKAWATGRRPTAAIEWLAVLSKDEAVKRAIAGCFPDGIPGDIVNPSLCRTLGNWLKINLPNMATISDSTMLRAAGRKKEAKAKRAK
jgi:hypothetical protein